MKVFIQNEAGSFVKNFFDEKMLKFIGMTRVSRSLALRIHPQHDGRRRAQRGLFRPHEKLFAYWANRRVRSGGANGTV